MRKLFATVTLAIFTCGVLIGAAQDTTKPAAPAAKPAAPDKKPDTSTKPDAAPKADAAPKKDDPAKKDDDDVKKGRLPPQYGKLGLNDSQKEKIYSIQGSYATKLDDLEAQMTTMRKQRDAEVEKVLTDDQRKTLKNLQDTKDKEKAEKDKAKKDDSKAEKAAPDTPKPSTSK